METTIIVKESFYDGIIHIDVSTEDNQIVRRVYLGYKDRAKNLYLDAKSYIEDYNNTTSPCDKRVGLDNIKSILERFDAIRTFCKEKLSPNDKLVMEEEFETIYCKLKDICG